ncbi:MAG: LacI family DNA-binding transcriptional regulator [Actinobacteria bacterium]|nr:LacI family DNA-binding transcriptional regulator [Actinomycetota bacterium]
MVTIFDVEKLSGVSKATISRFLNGKTVRNNNAEKIQKAIKELNYNINPLASGLKSNKTNTIGVVIPVITDQFFPPILRAFEKFVSKNNYYIILNNYNIDEALEKEQVRNLVNKKVDGIILATSSYDGEHVKECLKNKIPVVLLDRLIPGIKCDSVVTDNYQSTFDAISLCIRKGHKKIAMMRGVRSYTDDERFKGYRDALDFNQLELRKEYITVTSGSYEQDDAKRDFMRLLNLKEPPTLIFCSNIYLSAGALKARLEYNINIPEEVSVIAFDQLSKFPNYSFVSLIRPEFSGICQPLDEIGLIAGKLMLERIKKGMDNYEAENIELKTIFIMTESVAELR